MNWATAIKGFNAYLKLEKSLSANSIDAYLHDVEKLKYFTNPEETIILNPLQIKLEHLQAFVKWVAELPGPSAATPIIWGDAVFASSTDTKTKTLRALAFDRKAARGYRLNIAAGTAVRFEPGQERTVELVDFAGDRKVYGFRGQIQGAL